MSASTRRPAEAAALGGSAVTAIAYAAGAPDGVVAALGIAVGIVPACVTWLVTHGGISGTFRILWRGSDRREH